jgi:hypothetical protein
MGYKLVASDNFEVDHTLDPAYWVWHEAPPYIVLGGHMTQDSGEVAGMGAFVAGGSHMAQRTTVKFTRIDPDAWIYILVRVHEDSAGNIAETIRAILMDDALYVSSGGGSFAEADDPAVLAVGTPYWGRVTIDAAHSVSAEIFDADPNSGAQAIHFVSSDLPDVDEETYPGYTTTPGCGGLRATPGIIIDEIIYEVPEVHHMDDKNVPHEGQVAKAVDAQARRTSDHAAIPDLTPAASGTYVQAEASAVRGKVNEILDVLRDAELIPPA